MATTLADDIFKCIFLNENIWISIRISLKFFLGVPMDNNPSLVQIMAWCLTGDKPLSEPMMAYFTEAYASLGLNELKRSDKYILTHFLPRRCGNNLSSVISNFYLCITDRYIVIPGKLFSCEYHRTHWWYVSIGSGNGLGAVRHKPLPWPMLTQIDMWPSGVTGRQWVNTAAPTDARLPD